MKDLLIICSTHGDEGFSIPLVKKLSNTYGFNWIIGNPKANKIKTRFVESDLNRSAPGNINGCYEEKRALEILKIAKNYKIVIDIHVTVSNTGLFIILSDPCCENIKLSKDFSIKNVVLWPSFSNTGPLTQFIPNSLEIECGQKNSKRTIIKLEKVLINFLKNKNQTKTQDYFIVTGKYKSFSDSELYDFRQYKSKNESFYPLMVGQYQKFKCYKMQKLDDTL